MRRLFGALIRRLSSFTAGRDADHGYSYEASKSLLNKFSTGEIDEFFAVNGANPFIHVGGDSSCLSIGHQTNEGLIYVLDGEPTLDDAEALIELLYLEPAKVLAYSTWTKT